MFTSSEQFITQMKFRELREQREKALAAYEQLEHMTAMAPDDAARLRVLYAGLQELRFAKQALHPNVANLELIIHELDQRWVPTETIAFWRAELARELERGKMRAEIVYTFGALLEEWAAENARETAGNLAQDAARVELLARASQDRAVTIDTRFIDELIAASNLADEEWLKEWRQTIAEALTLEITYLPDGSPGLAAFLKPISMDPFRSASVRGQAQRFLLDPMLLKELTDALTILIDHLDEWDWPASGVPAQAQFARSKWRLVLDEDLPTALFLDYLGERWRFVFDSLWRRQSTTRLWRLKRLLELGAPDVIIRNERQMLGRGRMTNPQRGLDIWAVDEDRPTELDPNISAEELLTFWGESGSIYEKRATAQDQLRRFDRFNSYNDMDATGGMDAAVNLIHAEIELGRAAFPERPMYVVKLDLMDYYPSLSHELVLALLDRLGLPPEQLEFFRRYLRVRINDDGREVIVRSGLTIRRRLADSLSELILRLMDAHVERAARVQVVRFMDDICLIAASAEEAVKAWNAAQAFCQACGLALNEAKCGAVCIGGELPPELPDAPPQWLLLALDRDGQWQVHAPAFEAHLEQTRQQLARANSIIARTQLYNAGATYLEQALALNVALGAIHRRSVDDAVARWHYTFFGDDSGIVGTLRSTIRERFVTADPAVSLPEAWFYWPITAGGLGLRQIVLRAGSYAEGARRHQQPPVPHDRPDDWQRRANEWATVYGALLAEVKPVDPAPNQVMETLVRDFISRGADLSSGKQKTLSAYWRWILYIYGPQILDSFGTFRFLFGELVPLQLLTERFLDDTEVSEIIGGGLAQ